jgi:sporulation protein YlmC with PRC-barrel domain
VRLKLGNPVRCSDGAVRELADVVIDSGSKSVTHLVVQPQKEPEAARLVPIELAGDAPGEREEISLRCTSELLERLEPVREYAYLRPGEQPEQDSKWDVGVEDMYSAPNYGPSDFGEYAADLDSGVGISYDRVPKGEIELRHASAVYSSDQHHLGRVEGLLVDADDHVTHVLLERGHLWWRREIAVPAESISKFETDMVTLGVTKDELGALRSGSAG